ncbi:MAG TPA: PAS domain-containing protein [Geopsychrobacteraceae bacterium]|nr:PAS domain-containing protein [Geopsychrobacteraceae bacterium]
MIISIFSAETIIMFTLALLPPIPAILEALVDASGLLIILSPTFYFFHYRPIQHHYQDRKRIIERLSASEERLQLALQAVNDSLWDCNLTTGEIYVSPRGEKMLGYEPGEIEPNIEAWRDLLHPDEREHVLALQKKHLSGESSHYTTEHRLKSKNDAGWIWVLARGQVVSWNEEGTPVRMIGTHTDITLRKQAEEALKRSEEEIRSLSHKLIHTSEEEKKSLAQDFHDEFGQVLTAFQIGVEMLRDHRYEDESDYQFHCKRLLKLVARLEVDLRNICDQLRPVMLDDVGLIETLRWHINEFVLLYKSIDIDFQIKGDHHISREMEIVLYRICQEGLNNIVKHAGARKIKIELVFDPGQVALTITDDGHGMDEAFFKKLNHETWGLGLLGMRERAAAVGGRLIVESKIGKGTMVRAELPIKETEVFVNVD